MKIKYKEQLIDAVIEQIEEDLSILDVESLQLLLDYLSVDDLLGYLPENKQKEFL